MASDGAPEGSPGPGYDVASDSTFVLPGVPGAASRANFNTSPKPATGASDHKPKIAPDAHGLDPVEAERGSRPTTDESENQPKELMLAGHPVAEVSSSIPSTEEALVFSQGFHGHGVDSKKLNQLLSELVGSLYETLGRMTNNKPQIEDIVAQTFQKAQEKIKTLSFKSNRSFRAWLRKIAVHLLYNCRRQESTKAKKLQILPRPGGPLPPEELVGFDQQTYIIQEAIGCLEEKLRILIVLRYWDDLSEHEIAQMLEIKVGTVKSRLHRARNMLKTQLPDRKDLFRHEAP